MVHANSLRLIGNTPLVQWDRYFVQSWSNNQGRLDSRFFSPFPRKEGLGVSGNGDWHLILTRLTHARNL